MAVVAAAMSGTRLIVAAPSCFPTCLRDHRRLLCCHSTLQLLAPSTIRRQIVVTGRCKPRAGLLFITATSMESRGDNQEKPPVLNLQEQASYVYRDGWRKLSQVSAKFMQVRHHSQSSSQGRVDDPSQGAGSDTISAQENGACGGAVVVDSHIHDDVASLQSQFSSFCCKGLVIAMALLCAAALVQNAGFQLSHLLVPAQTFLATVKSFPSMAMAVLSQSMEMKQLGSLGTSPLTQPQPLRLDVRPPNLTNINWTFARLSYTLDVLLERHPISYVFLLTSAILLHIFVGGIFFYRYRGQHKQSLGDAFWDAWACVCSSGTHLKEKTQEERTIGILLAFGGLLFYSLLTSTMTAQIKSRMDWLREGAHSQVMESGHIVVCGVNSHLTTVLKQLNTSHKFAIQDGRALTRKQRVLLLSERARRDTEKLVSHVIKECTEIDVLTRSGSLSSTRSFEKVAADKAQSIVFLSNKDDTYEADAESVLSVLALQPLLDDHSSGNVVVEVSKKSTADLLNSLSGLKVSAVQNLSSKLFVQCSRQCGLINVYQQLLDHGKTVINLRNFPNLAGLTYGVVRCGFPEAVVCGLIRGGGGPDFHPADTLHLHETDKLILIAKKHTHRVLPPGLLATADEYQKMKATSEASGNEQLMTPQVEVPVELKKAGKQYKRTSKLASKTADWTATRKERIVMLGWRPGVSEMVREYDDYVGSGSVLVVLAEAQVDERIEALKRRISTPLRNINVVHKLGNPMSRTDLRDAILGSDIQTDSNVVMTAVPKTLEESNEKLPLSIVVIGDKGWLVGDTSKPDKQAVFALLLAESICKEHNVKVSSLVAEFVDTELGKQVVKSHSSLTYIGTSVLSGLVTSQVVEHAELNAVWTELLNSWGNEIYMKGIELYVMEGETPSFVELTERAKLQDEVAIGFRRDNKVVLNPSSKESPLDFLPGDALVVISEFE
ncbi:unnamed protein product [Sphagnum balticum]